MPYADILILQSKQVVVSGRTSPHSVSFDNPVAGGSMAMFIGGAVNGATDVSAQLGTPTGGGTWTSVTNALSSGASGPTACGALVTGLAAGSPAFSLPFTSGGVDVSGDLRISGVLLEFVLAAPSPLDGAGRTGTSATSATSTSAAATGTLSQSDNIIVGAVVGYIGISTNPAGYSSLLNQQNGVFPGAQVSWKKVTATTTQTFTVTHDPASAPGGNALVFVVKAADSGGFVYEFDFPADGLGSIPSGQSAVRMIVARNFDPFVSGAGTYEYYSAQVAEAGTDPMDATTRRLIVSSGLPSGVTLTDTLRASLELADASAGSVGWPPGVVKAV